MFLAIVFVAVCLVWGCVEMWKNDFVPIGVNVSEDQVEITSGYSDYVIDCDDITGVELLEKLPDDDYRKINEERTRIRCWQVQRRKYRKVPMYLYVGYTPILRLRREMDRCM